MDQNEYLQHWNYFCSLSSDLENTKDYVFHGLSSENGDKPYMIHGNVYSDRFKQIIILAASEFEIVSKALCTLRGENAQNIVDISRVLLRSFPNMIQSEIMTAFYTGTPLNGWSVDADNRVLGLDWWRAYNSLKHNEVDSYKNATLENAVLSLASLYIVDLYLMYELCGSLALAYHYPPVYFRSKYTAHTVNSGEGSLPDYGNQSPMEKVKEKYPDLFKEA